MLSSSLLPPLHNFPDLSLPLRNIIEFPFIYPIFQDDSEVMAPLISYCTVFLLHGGTLGVIECQKSELYNKASCKWK